MAIDQAPLLEKLRQRVARLETGGRTAQHGTISCGCSSLDDLLPGRGLNPGTLNEWVEHFPGSGGGWLSLLAARQALAPTKEGSGLPQTTMHSQRRGAAGGQMVVIDWKCEFQPAAARAAGISPERLIVLRPATRADGLWAIDQALRSAAISVVWGFLERLDDREARRLQLAAEVGNTLGLWLRPQAALSEPSWAEVRWYVRGLPLPGRPSLATGSAGQPQLAIERRLEARLTRCRGGQTGQRVVLEIDSAGRARHVSDYPQTAAMPLVAKLAHPTTHRQRTQQRTA